MHLGSLLPFTLSLLAMPVTATLHAQFQAPMKAELEMTSDPKAPGASAVYLYLEEQDDDRSRMHTIYARMKVLTEKGKEAATIRIPYVYQRYNVSSIAARTLHADGSIFPMTAQASDLVDVKIKGLQINSIVFTLPAVEVGSILEYSIAFHHDKAVIAAPSWKVQQDYFVHKAHYTFRPALSEVNNIMYAQIGPNDAKLAFAKDCYTYDITDVPPIPTDDWMPPLNSIRWSIRFYYADYKSGNEFWAFEGKEWAEELDKFTRPTRHLKDAIAMIVSTGDSDEQKARKLYDAVMRLENTDFTREKSAAERKKEHLKEVRSAQDVWEQKSGSSDDLALLYFALCRAAGLHARPMQVVNRDRAIFDPGYLTIGQLDDFLVILDLDGKELMLDPGQKMCPFGMLHWKHSLASGLQLSPAGYPVRGTTPAARYTESATYRIADLALDAPDTVKGTARFIMSGQDALAWRQLALANDEGEVRKKFNESLRAEMPTGVQAELNHFAELDRYDSKLTAFIDISGNIGTVTAKHSFLPAFLFHAREKHPFVAQDQRTIPVDVQYPRIEKDEVTYHLPPGQNVEVQPQPTNVAWTDNAVLKANGVAEGNDVTVGRTLAFNFTVLPPQEYGGLHQFFKKVVASDQQQLVLTRSQGGRGN